MPITDETNDFLYLPPPQPLERLEYGKLCVTPNGPIVSLMAGHRHLGWTSDFSSELKSLCEPTIIGVSTSEHEDLPRRCPHGTVLRPVVLKGKVRPVFCRVRKRPEKGEGTESRLYTLARYLTPPKDRLIEPSILFDAMGPLRGMTEDEAQALKPVLAESGSERLAQLLNSETFRPQARRFVKVALIYVMSGIPVSIADYIEEEEFFGLVTVLWRMLPSWLRPYLSAGWGVSDSLSGKLTVTYARQRADFCASFSRAEDGKWIWTVPREAPNYDQKERERFQREHVAAGAHYVSYVFGCEPYNLPKITEFKEQPRAEELLKDRLPEAYAEEIKPLDFDDPMVAAQFFAPGQDARDRHLLEKWEQYLATNDNELPEPVPDFVLPEHKQEAFRLVREALADVRRRRRADVLLWHLVAASDAKPPLEWNAGFGAARLRLFEAIRDGNLQQLLEALSRSADAGEADWLPDAAREALGQRLTSSLRHLDPEQARLHLSLLDRLEPPPDYLDWIKRNAFEVALSSTGLTNEWSEALYQRIKSIPDSPSVRMLLSWEDGGQLSPENEEAFRALRAKVRHQFFDQLVKRWEAFDKNRAARREQLLPWLRLAYNEEQFIGDPLLSLAFGTEPKIEDLAALATEIELQGVPHSLGRQVARLVLKYYPQLSQRIRQEVKSWSAMLRYWPADVLAALFPEMDLRSEVIEGSEEEYYEAERLRFDAEELEQLIRSGSQLPPTALRWYWKWAKSCSLSYSKSGALVVRICKYILLGSKLPESFDTSDVGLARLLAEADGSSLPELRSQAEKLWSEKNKEILEIPQRWSELSQKGILTMGKREHFCGEQERIAQEMLVLLYFYPDVDFIPTTQQLNLLLITYRNEVRKHLSHPEGLHSNRPRWFWLITAQPMESAYPGTAYIDWKDEYAECVFWIVFKGVPVKKQWKGSLGKALDFYAGEPSGALRSKRERYLANCVEICATYLNSYSGAELRKALRIVLNEFVLRWLHLHERRDETEIRSILISAPITGNSPFWELVRLIRELDQKRIVSKAIDEYFSEIRR